jgi:hypothetical protein
MARDEELYERVQQIKNKFERLDQDDFNTMSEKFKILLAFFNDIADEVAYIEKESELPDEITVVDPRDAFSDVPF